MLSCFQSFVAQGISLRYLCHREWLPAPFRIKLVVILYQVSCRLEEIRSTNQGDTRPFSPGHAFVREQFLPFLWSQKAIAIAEEDAVCIFGDLFSAKVLVDIPF